MFTFRSAAVQEEYDRFKTSSKKTDFDLSRSIGDFEYWAIIPNDFPYDMIAKKHDLLIPKRKITSFAEMTDAELLELRTIKETLDDHYTSIIENFTNMRSIRDHIHLHLINWHEDFFRRASNTQELLDIAHENITKNPKALTADYYIKGMRDEITEAEEEIHNNNTQKLEDELSDVLWDYFNLLHILEKEDKIESVNCVFERAPKKYKERLSAMLNGSPKEWQEIKEKQKKDLESQSLTEVQ